MPRLTVVDWAGESHDIEAREGASVMESIRRASVDDLAALCGGSCSCATCHVYVDNAFLPLLPPREANEAELLEALDTCRDNSRLSCQIIVTPALDGMAMTIAPEE